MQHDYHIERYKKNLENMFKENDLALKTLYEYLSKNSINLSTIIKRNIEEQDYYYFEISHNVREFSPITSEIDINENIRIKYTEKMMLIKSKSLNYLIDLAKTVFQLNVTVIA